MSKKETLGGKHEMVDNLEEVVIALILCPANGSSPWDPRCTWGQPGLFWGPPGIGKSARVNYAGLSVSLRTEVVIAATQQPEAVSGALLPDGQGGGRIVSLLPGIRRLIEDQQGILFLDELSCARPAVQAAFLNVVLERRVGEDKLPGGVRVLAAANPPDEAAGGWDLEPPMANRFVHLYTRSPTWEEWNDWLMNEKPPALQSVEDGENTIRAGWASAWSRARGLFAGYQRSTGGEKMFNLPKEGNDDRGRAWASPRTWEMAARLFATSNILGKQHLLNVLLSGCLGKGVALELQTWLADADLPDPIDVIKGKWSPDIKRLDRVVAAYTSTTSYILSERDVKNRQDMAVDYWSALKVGMDNGASDIIKNMAQALVTNGLGRKVNSAMSVAATPVLVKLAKDGFGEFV
jgi:hypothetical protein